MKDILKKLWAMITFWRDRKKDKPDDPEVGSFPASVPNNGADVSGWPQTCTIGNVRWQSPGITWDYTDEGDRDTWPIISKDLNGHLCALVQKPDGTWNQCFLDSLRGKGRNGWNQQTLKPFQVHGDLIESPLNGWKAKKGERIGIYIVSSGWAYPDTGTHKRSNVVWTEYPY